MERRLYLSPRARHQRLLQLINRDVLRPTIIAQILALPLQCLANIMLRSRTPIHIAFGTTFLKHSALPKGIVLQSIVLVVRLRLRHLVDYWSVILNRRLLPKRELLILIKRPQRAAIPLLHVQLHALVGVLRLVIGSSRGGVELTGIMHARRLLRFEKQGSHIVIRICFCFSG